MLMLWRAGACSLALSLLLASTPAAAAFSKNTIAFPAEPYAVAATNADPGWIKFTILTSDLGIPYFETMSASRSKEG